MPYGIKLSRCNHIIEFSQMLFILSGAYTTDESNSKSYLHLFDLQNESLLPS